MHIITIDCGASFIKGARVDGERNILRTEQRATPVEAGQSVKQLDKTLNAVREIVSGLSNPGEDFVLAISNEMHGFVLADRDGRPYLDYVSWQDESSLLPYQGENYMSYVKQTLSEKDILDTGMPVKVGLPSVNLFYYLNTKLSGVDTDNMFFYTLGDYILYRISGISPCIHPTNAAACGLYSLSKGQWSTEILRALGFGGIHFPEISECKPLEFTMDDRRFIAYPAIGDQQAALLGVGISQLHELSINMGTGAQVAVLSDTLQLSVDYQTRPFFRGKHLKTVPHIPSGRALNVYFRFVKEIILSFDDNVQDGQIWKYIMESADKCDVAPMEVDLSFFPNAITLHQTGSISEIRETDLSLGNLFRSVFMQMAKNVNAASKRIIYPQEIQKILFSGGMVQRNDLLRRFILDSFSISSYGVGDNDTFLGLAEYARLAIAKE